MNKKIKLIPPDPKQCQGEKREGCWPDALHFMIIGPGILVRCKNKPTVIVKENKPRADGQRGSMSLCDICLQAMIKQFGGKFCSVNPIKKHGKRKKSLPQNH